VILLLLDSLREDFVEISDASLRHLNIQGSKYKSKKIKLFQNISDSQPYNTYFAPMRSERPTVTTVRVKSLMTGALNALIEAKDNFGGD
jgi:hypothetical protein